MPRLMMKTDRGRSARPVNNNASFNGANIAGASSVDLAGDDEADEGPHPRFYQFEPCLSQCLGRFDHSKGTAAFALIGAIASVILLGGERGKMASRKNVFPVFIQGCIYALATFPFDGDAAEEAGGKKKKGYDLGVDGPRGRVSLNFDGLVRCVLHVLKGRSLSGGGRVLSGALHHRPRRALRGRLEEKQEIDAALVREREKP